MDEKTVVIQAVKAGIKHRKSIWQFINNKLLGEKREVAFFGAAGAGKTVLLDYLSGIAYKQDYQPPGTSQRAEKTKGKIPKDSPHGIPKRRLGCIVIPGSESTPRFETIDDLLDKHHGVFGIVHVVCNGFKAIRNEDAKRVLINQYNLKTIQNLRDNQKQEELKDLDLTCNFVKESIRKYDQPKWMIIALTKVDLYYDTLETDMEAYSPLFKTSEFSIKLNELQNFVGKANFRLELIPVCSWLEDFKWNQEVASSKVNQETRDDFIKKLLEKIKSYC